MWPSPASHYGPPGGTASQELSHCMRIASSCATCCVSVSLSESTLGRGSCTTRHVVGGFTFRAQRSARTFAFFKLGDTRCRLGELNATNGVPCRILGPAASHSGLTIWRMPQNIRKQERMQSRQARPSGPDTKFRSPRGPEKITQVQPYLQPYSLVGVRCSVQESQRGAYRYH